MTPEEREKRIIDCFNGCCDCETHTLDGMIAAQIREAVEEGRNEIRSACSQHQHEQYADGFKAGKAEAYEHAAKILEGDVLKHPDEFEGKTKLKVFDLLERLASEIRACAKVLITWHKGFPCPVCGSDSEMPPAGSPDFPRCKQCGKEWYWRAERDSL